MSIKINSKLKEKIKHRFSTHPLLFSALVITLLCVLTFGRSLFGGYIMDDWPVVKENSQITEIKYIPNYFTQGVWANTDWADEVDLADFRNYRPLFLLLLNLEYQLWGESSLAYHAVNLILHIINSLLVFYLIILLLQKSGNESKLHIAAPLGAILFAVHPTHVESIAWISGVTDLLATLFILSTIIFYLKYSATRKVVFGVLAVTSYLAALLSKESVIFLPLLMVFYDILFEKKFYIRRYIPYGILFILYLIIRDAVLVQAGLYYNIENWDVLLQFVAYYFQLLFVPWPLEYYYGKLGNNILNIVAGACIIFALLYLTTKLSKKTFPFFAFSICCILVTLAPALSISLLKEPVFAIRVLYAPSIGLALLVAGLYFYSRVTTQRLIVTCWSIVTIIFMSLSVVEINDWKNDEVFYTQAAIASPESYRPYKGLVLFYERANNTPKIVEALLKGASLTNDDMVYIEFIEKVALLYGQDGDIEKSEYYYKDVINKAPKHSSAWVGLGNNALARKDTEQALEYYQEAFKADPANAVASYNLAMVYRSLGYTQEARQYQLITQQLQNRI